MKQQRQMKDVELFSELTTSSSSSSSGSELLSEQQQQQLLLLLQPETQTPPFEIGDHVYQWCRIVGIVPVFQHHGIVMGVCWDDCEEQWLLQISDFSNIGLNDNDNNPTTTTPSEEEPPSPVVPPTQAVSSSSLVTGGSNPFSFSQRQRGGWRSYSTYASKWNKVLYKATWWEKMKSPSGTCTSMDCDPPGVVQARVRFLQENSVLDDMPYHWLHANCECVAVWCKTGQWSTLQGLSFLKSTAAGNVKSTAMLTGTAAAATTTVSVPSAGIWGWMGFTTTTQVSLLAAQPWLIPILATYGVVTIGIPAAMILKARKQWQQTSVELNDSFWSHAALDQHHVFVECIRHYKHSNNDKITTD